jgi:hypothetical protein
LLIEEPRMMRKSCSVRFLYIHNLLEVGSHGESGDATLGIRELFFDSYKYDRCSGCAIPNEVLDCSKIDRRGWTFMICT